MIAKYLLVFLMALLFIGAFSIILFSLLEYLDYLEDRKEAEDDNSKTL